MSPQVYWTRTSWLLSCSKGGRWSATMQWPHVVQQQLRPIIPGGHKLLHSRISYDKLQLLLIIIRNLPKTQLYYSSHQQYNPEDRRWGHPAWLLQESYQWGSHADASCPGKRWRFFSNHWRCLLWMTSQYHIILQVYTASTVGGLSCQASSTLSPSHSKSLFEYLLSRTSADAMLIVALLDLGWLLYLFTVQLL